MRLLLFRLWPALIPIALYLLWFLWRRKDGTRPTLDKGPLFWTLLASAAIAIACFLWTAVHQEAPMSGHYSPPVYAPGGAVVKGSVDAETRGR